jgi:uncharacterized protein
MRMKTIVLNGSNGFLGQQICKYFDNKYSIRKINRSDYLLDPKLLAEKLKGADVIINLAGARISLFASQKQRDLIYRSRIMTTRNLMNAISAMDHKPELVISMSAVGIYDAEGVHDEYSEYYGTDFFAKVCKDWENELSVMRDKQIKTTIIRCGIVLSKNDGMLKKMIFPFRFGLGAVLGDGSQPVSFIHIHDFLRAFDFIIDHHLTGIINFVAPKFCTNLELSKTLSRAMRRPLFIRIPAGFIRIFTGRQSSMLLKGQRVVPKVLYDNGFNFKHSSIKVAIKNIIRFT